MILHAVILVVIVSAYLVNIMDLLNVYCLDLSRYPVNLVRGLASVANCRVL